MSDQGKWNIDLTKAQTRILCQGLEDGNRVLRRLKRDDLIGAAAAAAALQNTVNKVDEIAQGLPGEFGVAWKAIDFEILDIICEADTITSALMSGYAAMYTEVERDALDGLGADNADLVRGMFALRKFEIKKP